MNLSKAAQWMIRQALGSKRGALVISLLSGPIGAILDMAANGEGSKALAKLDGAVDAVREVIS